MIERDVERRLADAFGEARRTTGANPDLFARVERTVEDDGDRRRWRGRMAGRVALFAAALVAVALLFGDHDKGGFTMRWWLIELLTNVVLVAIAAVLGPFIKRFGRAYAADVFRANPRTGKSYLVLTDVAYYLIFSAFILFTISFKDGWVGDRPGQWKQEVARLGGILLIMGVLHAANVVALPVIGQMLSAKGLDGPSSSWPAPGGGASAPPGPGTWIVHIEPAAAAPPDPPTAPG